MTIIWVSSNECFNFNVGYSHINSLTHCCLLVRIKYMYMVCSLVYKNESGDSKEERDDAREAYVKNN